MDKLKLKEKIHSFLQEGNHTPLKMKAKDWSEIQEDKVLVEMVNSAEQAQDNFLLKLENIEKYLVI